MNKNAKGNTQINTAEHDSRGLLGQDQAEPDPPTSLRDVFRGRKQGDKINSDKKHNRLVSHRRSTSSSLSVMHNSLVILGVFLMGYLASISLLLLSRV